MLFKLRSVQHWHADETRWAVFASVDVMALLSFGASAWTLAGRDNFIGWHTRQRLKKNLHRVVNHARFLILAWIQCKGLASKSLSIVSRQLPIDWQHRSHLKPVLLETFVECERHRGNSATPTRPPIGSTSARPPTAARSPVFTRRSSPSRTSGCTH